MAYYQSWISRFILRKDFFRRANARLQQYARKLRKDELDDLAFLLRDEQPRIIFDCGANVGFVTNRFLRLFPSATVYSFEPNPAVYEPLHQTYASDPRVKTFQQAISKETGTLKFNQNANSGTSSLFEPTAYNRSHWARRSNAIDVEVTTLDQFAATQGIESIDILKLDLEGAEYDALLGADRLLEEQRVQVIYTEVALVPLYKDQPLLEDLIVHLRGKGYYLYNLYEFNESTIRQAILGNATFISTRLREALAQKWGAPQCGW
jgi:FkbM family methyltransferase